MNILFCAARDYIKNSAAHTNEFFLIKSGG
jgi:hypothetical protein